MYTVNIAAIFALKKNGCFSDVLGRFDRTTKIAVVFKKSEVAVIFIKERFFFLFFGFWRHASSPGLSEMARKTPRFSTPLLGSRH